jgi:hypothetical protein
MWRYVRGLNKFKGKYNPKTSENVHKNNTAVAMSTPL